MDSIAQRSTGHDPSRLREERESTWADVEAAQAALQRRFQPTWWAHLPQGAGVIGIVAWVTLPDAPVALYTISLLVLLMPRFLYSTRRGAEPRYLSSDATVGTLVLGLLALPVVWIVFSLVTPDDPPAVMTGALAVLLGAILVVTLTIADQRFLRSLPRLGSALAAKPLGAPGIAPPLQEPSALRAATLLVALRSMRGDALHEDLGLSMAETLRVVGPLQELGLLKVSRQLFTSREPQRRWFRLTPLGDQVLSGHLAALR